MHTTHIKLTKRKLMSNAKLLLAGAMLLLTGCGDNLPENLKLFPTTEKDMPADVQLKMIFGNMPWTTGKGVVRVFDADTDEIVDSLDIHLPAGPTDAQPKNPAAHYATVPYDYSRTCMATNKDTKPGTASGEAAESTNDGYQKTIIGGFTDGFHFHPMIQHSDTITFCLHNNMLDWNKSYYVTVEPEVIEEFCGIKSKRTWRFSTRKAPEQKDCYVVASDGSGDFCTLQGALDFIPDFSVTPITIKVKSGEYEEIVYARNKTNLTIEGEGMYTTKIHYANNEVFNPHPVDIKTNELRGTFPSRRAAVMFDNCSNVTLKEITFATDLKGQAEGLLVMGENYRLEKVRIMGDGDTFQVNGYTQMDSCEVIGGGDLILGRGPLVARNSQFKNQGGALMWIRNDDNRGAMFIDCYFEGQQSEIARAPENKGKTYPNVEVILVRCKLNGIIPSLWGTFADGSNVKLYDFETKAPWGGPWFFKDRGEFGTTLTEEPEAF